MFIKPSRFLSRTEMFAWCGMVASSGVAATVIAACLAATFPVHAAILGGLGLSVALAVSAAKS